MIRVYTQLEQGQQWLQRYRGCSPIFACVLGFTATGLIPGISAAGRTPQDRQYTAIADAEFLYNGFQPQPKYALPPLQAGASPVLISRAVVEALDIPIYLFNAGLPQPPTVPAIDLGGTPAKCLSGGEALELATVKHLLEQGLYWGQHLASSITQEYVILGECVVGGTTTALAVLTGLGIAASGKVNSSHPVCNHAQKWELVQAGLRRAILAKGAFELGKLGKLNLSPLASRLSPLASQRQLSQVGKPAHDTGSPSPLALVAAVGDPMQIALAGMAIALSRTKGVILAGGTQMLAVYALMQALVREYGLTMQPEAVVVGTTRWVAEDPTGKTVELAQMVGSVPLLASDLSFANSKYAQLRAYEQGYVKEGMGAGGCAIAAHLTVGWNSSQLLQAIETLLDC